MHRRKIKILNHELQKSTNRLITLEVKRASLCSQLCRKGRYRPGERRLKEEKREASETGCRFLVYICVCTTRWYWPLLLKTVKPIGEQGVQVSERVAAGCVPWVFPIECFSDLLCTGYRNRCSTCRWRDFLILDISEENIFYSNSQFCLLCNSLPLQLFESFFPLFIWGFYILLRCQFHNHMPERVRQPKRMKWPCQVFFLNREK